MTKEYDLLLRKPYAKEKCPICGEPFPEFMRGQVQSWIRHKLGLSYCAIICHNCKNAIGWEKP